MIQNQEKADYRKKSEVPAELIRNHDRRMRTLKPLRINSRTVIYVTPDKCNEEYRRQYIERMRLTDAASDRCIHGTQNRIEKLRACRSVLVEQVREMMRYGKKGKDIASELGIGISTANHYIKKIRDGKL